MKNPKALLIIDYTNDFVDTSGALTTGKPGQKIESEILKLANTFQKMVTMLFSLLIFI